MEIWTLYFQHQVLKLHILVQSRSCCEYSWGLTKVTTHSSHYNAACYLLKIHVHPQRGSFLHLPVVFVSTFTWRQHWVLLSLPHTPRTCALVCLILGHVGLSPFNPQSHCFSAIRTSVSRSYKSHSSHFLLKSPTERHTLMPNTKAEMHQDILQNASTWE